MQRFFVRNLDFQNIWLPLKKIFMGLITTDIKNILHSQKNYSNVGTKIVYFLYQVNEPNTMKKKDIMT